MEHTTASDDSPSATSATRSKNGPAATDSRRRAVARGTAGALVAAHLISLGIADSAGAATSTTTSIAATQSQATGIVQTYPSTGGDTLPSVLTAAIAAARRLGAP